jgi:hypothetical protein
MCGNEECPFKGPDSLQIFSFGLVGKGEINPVNFCIDSKTADLLCFLINIKQAHNKQMLKNLGFGGYFGIGVMVASLVFGGFLHANASVTSGVGLNFSKNTIDIEVGETVSVDVILENPSLVHIDGLDFYALNFDAGMLQVVDADATANGVQIGVYDTLMKSRFNSVDNARGKIYFTSSTDGGTRFNGSEKLAHITFKAINSGTSYLQFDFVFGSTADTNVSAFGTDILSSVSTASVHVSHPSDTASPVIAGVSTAYANGTLILDDGTIYVIENGFKRGFTSMEVFTGLGYKMSNVITADTSGIPAGPDITTIEIRHPVGTLVVHEGTVYMLGAMLRYPFPSQEVFLSWGYDFNDIVPANSYDLYLPVGPVVGFKAL